MVLNEVEKILAVQFPKLFNQINQSGMTEHLNHSVKNRSNKVGFFEEGMSDCLLINFDDIQAAYKDLYEDLSSLPEIYPEYKCLDPKYKLVPFARSIGGDKYCFLYEEGKDEPNIVIFGHDTGEVDLWANDFEEFIYFQIVSELADGINGETIDSDYMQAHIQLLNDEHKKTLKEKPIDELFDSLPEPTEFIIWMTDD